MITQATTADLDDVYFIYETLSLKREKINDLNYQTTLQKDGFLLGLETKEDYKRLITEACEFLVYKEDDKVVGYAIADHRDKFLDDEYKRWFDEQLKDTYYNDHSAMTLSVVAIKKEKAGTGIATSLLKKLESNLKNKGIIHLYSIVTIAPITNCPSIVFHAKNGFRRVAMGVPRTLFNLENYSAILLYKQV